MAKKQVAKKEGSVKASPTTKEVEYKVDKTFCLTGKGSAIYKSGDIVTAKCFASKEIVEQHVKNGFLVENK